jgi:hypothetical protein
MGNERDGLAGYFSRLVGGLVACAVAAVSLHAEVAGAAMLVAVLLVVVAVSCLMLRRVV